MWTLELEPLPVSVLNSAGPNLVRTGSSTFFWTGAGPCVVFSQ